MKSDDEIKTDWARLENQNISKACELLSRHESDIEDYIADIVASICNINTSDMLSDVSLACFAQPRWLYWYAIRYMTNETYEKIAMRMESKCGYKFTANGIGQSINKMDALINREPMWTKRWTIIKHIIKLRDVNGLKDESITFRVIAPKGVKLELKTE